MAKDFTRKLYLIGFIALGLTLFYYQVLKGDYYLQRAKNNYVRVIPLRSLRGNIHDKNGICLAYDKASFNIAVIPYQIRENKETIFEQISQYLNCDINDLHKNYKRNLTGLFSPVDIVRNIDKVTALKLKEKFENYILINSQPQRYYSYPEEFAHILGYVKEALSFYEDLKKYGYSPMERAGFSGIEQYYDDYLRGKDGGDLIEVNASGRIVGFLGERKPEKGKDIYLTIDQQIQEAAYKIMEEKRGTIIFMKSQTGEIVTMTSLPSFDSNAFIEGRNLRKIFRNKHKPLLNRAIQATYPLGSTFKPVIGFAALQEEKIKPGTTITCKGSLNIGNANFKCWNTHGQEDLFEAIAHSCNVYFYTIGMICGVDIIAKWAKNFGLDSLTEIDLPYEKKGLVPTKEWKFKTLKTSWYGGDTVNLSIGQGFIETTPLEITTAINVFATQGYLVKPHLLKRVGNIESSLTTKMYVGGKKEHFEVIKQGMTGVVDKTDGTAHILKSLKLKIAGKTGTAQTKGKAHGWFIGFFPYDNPEYTICVFMENSGSSYSAVKTTYYFLKELKSKNLL